MYKYILFDLDGTLTNPEKGIVNSIVYALKKIGIEENDRKSLNKFIGPPLMESFEKFYGFSKEKSALALKYYREYFSVKGLYENEVYEGIKDVLATIKKQGKKIILATSKPEKFAIEILKHFKLYDYFDFIAGATMDETRNEKADVISYALESLNICDLQNAVMVGDRKHDILGAKQIGIKSVGVLFGFGSKEELISAGADNIAENAKDILNYI